VSGQQNETAHRAGDRFAVEAANRARDEARNARRPLRHVAAVRDRGALGTRNGPSIVLGVAPLGRRLLMASTSMLTPSTSAARMNSCRFCEHSLPVRVSQSIDGSRQLLSRMIDAVEESVNMMVREPTKRGLVQCNR
jgi:hypothetical protein